MKDYSELVRRLSDADDAIRGCGCCTNGLDAAAAILALTARVKELEEALRDVGRIWRRVEHVVNPPDKWGPWLEWGGESPTGPGFDRGFEVTVEVHRRDPRSDHFLISKARNLDWSHTGGGDDILYFREKDEGQEMLAALSGRGV